MIVTSVLNQCVSIPDIQQIRQSLPHPNSQKVKVLLLDFDDTLVMSGHAQAGHLGGMKWRDILRKTLETLKQAGEISEDQRLFGYLTLFLAKAAQVLAVQPKEITEVIEDLESSGVKVMVFTARGNHGPNAWYKLNIKGIDGLTEQQMHGAGIKLSQTPLPSHVSIYNHSLIMCQNLPKEKVIQELFDKQVFNPAEIGWLAFVDDKSDSVTKLQQFAQSRNIQFFGFHYTAVEQAEEREFDLLTATIQLVHLLTRKSFLDSKDLETRRRELMTQHHFKAEECFKDVVRKINRIFIEKHVYVDFNTPDALYGRVSEVLANANLLSFSIQSDTC